MGGFYQQSVIQNQLVMVVYWLDRQIAPGFDIVSNNNYRIHFFLRVDLGVKLYDEGRFRPVFRSICRITQFAVLHLSYFLNCQCSEQHLQ